MVPGNETENLQTPFKMTAKSKIAVKIYIVILIF